MTTPNRSEVLTAVAAFVSANERPCPASHLVEKYGTDVVDVVEELKESGGLVGLRGRNGGLAAPNSSIVAKRSEYAQKKAAKEAAKLGAEAV